MCEFHSCKTETEPSGFCIVCGKEVCSDCADEENPKMHLACNFCIWANLPISSEGPIDADVPSPG
jgi:hypothetical protein